MMAAAAKPLRRIDTEMARDNQTRDGRVQQAVRRRNRSRRTSRSSPGLMMHGHHHRGGAGNPEGQPERRALLSGRTVRLVRLDGQVFRREGAPQKDRAFWLQSYNGGSYTVRPHHARDGVHREPVGVDPRRHPARADPQACRGRRGRRASAAAHSDRAAPGRGWPGRASGQAVFDYNDLISNLRQLKPPTTGGIMRCRLPP